MYIKIAEFLLLNHSFICFRQNDLINKAVKNNQPWFVACSAQAKRPARTIQLWIWLLTLLKVCVENKFRLQTIQKYDTNLVSLYRFKMEQTISGQFCIKGQLTSLGALLKHTTAYSCHMQ